MTKLDMSEFGFAKIGSQEFVWAEIFRVETQIIKKYFVQLAFENAVRENASLEVDLLQLRIYEEAAGEFGRRMSGPTEICFREIYVGEDISLPTEDST